MMIQGQLIDNLTRIARHISYVSIAKEPECAAVHEVESDEKCEYVRKTESCHENVKLFDSMNFLYCDFTYESTAFYFAFFLLILLILYLFFVLGQTADTYFCPALALICEKLRISETVAGVTILAFGNGSPDIFTAIASMNNDTEQIYAELLGAAIFIITCVGGSVLTIMPTQIEMNYVARDIGFFFCAVGFISFCMHDQAYSMIEAGITLGIYVLYLVYVVVEHFITVYRQKRIKNSGGEGYDELKQRTSIKIDRLPLVESEEKVGSNHRLFPLFFIAINPVDIDDFRDGNFLQKIIAILLIPVNLLLCFTIPLVDHGAEKHGWCKLLNIIHLFTVPAMTVFATDTTEQTFGVVPIWGVVFPISFVIALIVFFTSDTLNPPVYFDIYAISTFVASILIISITASEIVCVLQTIGNVLELSPALLGISILAWGNSVGDFFTNTALARKGYQRMAFAACFGGPMFNTILGIAVTVMVKAMATDNLIAKVRDGVIGPNCSIFLFHILIFLFFGLLLTNFSGRRSLGIFLVILYLMFLLFTSLSELEIIHALGTDHNNDLGDS